MALNRDITGVIFRMIIARNDSDRRQKTRDAKSLRIVAKWSNAYSARDISTHLRTDYARTSHGAIVHYNTQISVRYLQPVHVISTLHQMHEMLQYYCLSAHERLRIRYPYLQPMYYRGKQFIASICMQLDDVWTF